MSHRRFDVVTGSTTGVIKGVNIGRTKKENRIKSLQNLALITESDRVTRIAWGDDDEEEILVACGSKESQKVKIFDAESGVLTKSFHCNIGRGDIVGISQYKGSILTAVNSGEICTWSASGKGEVLLTSGNNLSRMCHSREQQNLIAIGGEENMLKFYDLEKEQLTFIAKNLPHDWLNLRRKVSISDLSFLPGSQQAVTVGRNGHIHLYDVRTQRRPVIHMALQDEAWTSVAIPPREKHIIAGSGKGKLNLVDLRKSGIMLNTYKGFSGGVTGVTCSITNPYVASVSLDRHLRVHDINTKELLKCIYLTSKLSGLIMRSDITIEIGCEDGTET